MPFGQPSNFSCRLNQQPRALFALAWRAVSFWCVLGSLLLATQSALALNVNILISPPRGGYGDTAANLLMIERLTHNFRDSDLNFEVLYLPSSAQQIHDLWPDFKMDGQRQLIRGLVFTPIRQAPPADFVVSFSAATDLSMTPEVLSLNGIKIIYVITKRFCHS